MAQHPSQCAACQHGAPCRASCSGSRPPCCVWAQALYGPFLALLRRLRGARDAVGADAGSAPARLADRRRLQRGGGDRRQGRQRARARLAARASSSSIVAVDGGAEAGADRTAELARAAGADQVLELPRGGKVRAQDAAVRAASGELLAFGDANATWAPDALERARSALRRPAGRLRVRARAVRLRRRHQPGGRVLALRAVAARAGVGARVGDRGQRRDLRGPPARPTSRSTR